MSFTSVTDLTVDTNILIYSIDPTDEVKHTIAKTVMAEVYLRGGPLPLQCLTEFYAACTRKAHLATSHRIAEVVANASESMQIFPASHEDLFAAMQIHQQHRIQFFDALLLATARRAVCKVMLSEDVQDGHDYDGITVRNPFTPGFDLTAL
jgi:predicted nucleic acid-binding protein